MATGVTDLPIYNRLAVLRTERGLSRHGFAEAVGIHYQTVGYLERGEYAPSLALAFRIANFFAVPIEVVFSPQPFASLTAPAPAPTEGIDDDRNRA